MLLRGCLILFLITRGSVGFDGCENAGPDGSSGESLEEEVAFLQTGVQHSVLRRGADLTDHANGTVNMQTTTTSNRFFDNASRVAEVKVNAAGDLQAFVRSCILQTAFFLVFVMIFMILLRCYPQVYCNRVWSETIRDDIREADGPLETVDWGPSTGESLPWFGWFWASLFEISEEQVLKTSGLDAVMLLKFTHFAMELMLTIGIPSLIIMLPVYSFGGGGWAGKDLLEWAGIGNVFYRPTAALERPPTPAQMADMGDVQWVWWIVAIAVWLQVMWVQFRIFTYQHEFLEKRTKWLLHLPEPRSTTVLVEGIPDESCGDKELTELFEECFGEGSVENAFVVKKIWYLNKLVADYQTCTTQRNEVQFEIDEAQKEGETIKPKFAFHGGDKLDYYNDRLKALSDDIMKEQERLKKEAAKSVEDRAKELRSEPDTFAYRVGLWFGFNSETHLCSYNGFVTFKDPRKAEECLHMTMDNDENTLIISRPPAPEDVLYYGLSIADAEERLLNIIGYICLAALFFAFLPIILGIAQLADINIVMSVPIFRKVIDMTGLKSTLQGFLSSLGLTIMMSFLPTFLMIIFTSFFSAKASRWDQLRLQKWYFLFLVVFVLLITAVGGDLTHTIAVVVHSPLSVLKILAHKLPLSSHFYLNYVVVQPLTDALDLTRYMNLLKYIIYSRVCPPDVALQRAEPEDQDYNGMGGRSARFTLILLIGLVFGTIAPLIHVVVLWNFFVCRLIYGFMIPCTEQKKVDLGGLHWDLQLHHISLGMLIYIAMMTGVLLQRAESQMPGFLALLSVVFWAFSYYKFRGKMRTDCLGFRNVKQMLQHSATSKNRRRLFSQLDANFQYGHKEIYAEKPDDLLRIRWPD